MCLCFVVGCLLVIVWVGDGVCVAETNLFNWPDVGEVVGARSGGGV